MVDWLARKFRENRAKGEKKNIEGRRRKMRESEKGEGDTSGKGWEL